MQVQSGAANDLLTSTNIGTITGFVPVADQTRSFAWVSGMTNGGGNAHPRDMWQMELADSSTINLQRGRTGQQLSYRYFVVELPTDGTNGGGGNQAPVANAGVDQSAVDGNGDTLESILLDASASSDADGTITSYEWREGATLLATGVNPIISLAVGTHTIDLTVTDDAGATAVDTVIITIDAQTPPPNQAPTANAGADQTLVDSDGNGSETVTLNGSASADGDGSIASYEWREGATLIASGVNPPATLALGAHTIQLTVTDDAGATAVDSVIVTIDSAGATPQGTVTIGGPASINRGDRANFTVSFTNTGSVTITGVQLSFTFAPNSLLKNVSPGSLVAVGDLTAGASVSQTWSVRADNQGTGTFSGSATSGGATLDTASQSLRVIK
jgi:uncharacterized repeat protein (TIGR01451 family)